MTSRVRPFVALPLLLSGVVAAPVAAQARPGKTLTPAVVPVRAGPTRATQLFRDDFSAFPSVEGQGGRYRKVDEGLEVTAGDDTPLLVILWDRGRMPANMRATVTVQVQRAGRGFAGGGLTWGVQNRDAMDRGLRAEISPSGRVLVAAPDAAAAAPMIQAAPSVLRGEGATNTLAVEVLQGHVTVLVNGAVVQQLDSRATGYLGVFADVGSRVVFSNLRVEQLN